MLNLSPIEPNGRAVMVNLEEDAQFADYSTAATSVDGPIAAIANWPLQSIQTVGTLIMPKYAALSESAFSNRPS